MESNRQKAKQLLTHYFETCFRVAGVRFENDNQVEVEAIIDAIFDEIEESETCDPYVRQITIQITRIADSLNSIDTVLANASGPDGAIKVFVSDY